MNRAELKIILEHVRGAFPDHYHNEHTENAWMRYLRDCSAEETMAALDAMVLRGGRSVSIGEIVQEIARVRARRVETRAIAFQPSTPDADAATQQRELREAIAQIAGGADGAAGFLQPARREPKVVQKLGPGPRALAAGTAGKNARAWRQVPPAAAGTADLTPERRHEFNAAHIILKALPDLGAEYMQRAAQELKRKLGEEEVTTVDIVIRAAQLARHAA